MHELKSTHKTCNLKKRAIMHILVVKTAYLKFKTMIIKFKRKEKRILIGSFVCKTIVILLCSIHLIKIYSPLVKKVPY